MIITFRVEFLGRWSKAPYTDRLRKTIFNLTILGFGDVHNQKHHYKTYNYLYLK